MSYLLLSARKDLMRRFADPLALLMWIGLPAMLGTLISLFAGNDGAMPTARILLVNQDDTAIGPLLGAALGASGADAFLSVEDVGLQAGQERIGDGDGTALLIVPAGFGDAVLNDRPTQLTLIVNPAAPMISAIVIEGLEIIGQAAFYGQRMLGEPVRDIGAGTDPDVDFFDSAAIADLAAEIDDRLRAAGNLLNPPILDLEFGSEEADGEQAVEAAGANFDLAGFILPGMIFMSILFIAQGMSDDLWKEKDEGTLRRAVSSPHSLLPFVAGKLLAGLLLIAMVGTVALLVGVWAFDLPLLRIPLGIVWCAFAGTALLGMFQFVAILGTSKRTANLITTMILFPLMMIGGSFFPFESMPAWMRSIGVRTPNGMAVVQLRELLFGAPEPAAVAMAAFLIAATAGASLFLCVRRLPGFVTP